MPANKRPVLPNTRLGNGAAPWHDESADMRPFDFSDRPFIVIWEVTRACRLACRLEGRCAGCRFLEICGGGFRVRAVQVHGNLWASDPACYLSDDEVAATE